MRTEPDLHDYLAWFSEKTQWFLKWKKLVSLSWWFGFVFFWRSSIAQKSQLPSMKSNIKCQLTEKPTKFQLLWAFSPQQAGVARHFWTQSSYNGLASAENLQKMGISTVTWKNVNLSKIILFHQCWRKNRKELFRKKYTRQADMLETITKILVFEISHHIIHHLSKSTTQPKFSSYLHLSPQWCRTSILTRIAINFCNVSEKFGEVLCLTCDSSVISFSWCYFLLDGSWAE